MSERQPGTAWLLFKVSLFTLFLPGSVAALVPYLLLGRPSLDDVDWLGASLLGVLPMVLGVALYLRSAYDFMRHGRGTPAPLDPPVSLVAAGPYRYTRNPMYLGVLTTLAGEAVLFRSLDLVVYLVVVAGVFQLFVVAYEERSLARQFGDGYARYRATVPRWIPRRSDLEELYRRSFLSVGFLVLAAGAIAHVVRLTVGLPLLEMPVSIHAFLVVLPAYATIGCLVYTRRLDLDGAARKAVFVLALVLLATTVVMHAYSIAAGSNEWYRVFPMAYSAAAAPVYAGLALFLKRRTVKERG